MIFTSFEYALLLAATFVAYWLLPGRLSRGVLLLASIAFYASWSVPYLGLMGASSLVGYAGAWGVAALRERSRARPTSRSASPR